MEVTPEQIAGELARRLIERGAVATTAKDGKRLFFMASRVYGGERGEIVVAMQDGGCYVWDGARPVSSFRLLTSGFRIEVAATLAAVLNEVYHLSTKKLDDGQDHEQRKRIERGPEDPSE